MTLTDPIADMLTRIRNALKARHPSVQMPSSQLKVALAGVLRDEGYIKGFQVVEENGRKALRLDLKYTGKKEPALVGLRRVSRPGLRVYAPSTAIPRVYGGLGVPILSTSQGVMSGDRARRARVGGEVLCYVW
ncbi:MAG: 30S ribosomal protein S8 [Chloroflexi bacterium]|nr:30S ribosomal protein S8 [Chloroflexota bacterium]